MENIMQTLIISVISGLLGAYATHRLTVGRDIARENKFKLLETYKLLAEILSEFDIFLKSQEYFCYNYEELNKELYYSQGRLEPLQNPDNLFNIENKGLSDFFDVSWKNKYYQFIALIKIIDQQYNDQIDEIVKLVDRLYETREACEMSDQYVELYEYIENLYEKFSRLNDNFQKSLRSY